MSPTHHAPTPASLSPQRAPFMETLRARWQEQRTMLCVGLDPELSRLPESIRAAYPSVEDALFAFCQAIVDATADLVCAFKPNSAFFEVHGESGWRALVRVVRYIHTRHPAVPVLLDAKRGDIGSTSQAYASAVFETIGADAVTLHPYLGAEALSPFLEREDRGCFILCRTSNPGAGEFQDLTVPATTDGLPAEPFYVRVARRVAGSWNRLGNCGLVVGATYPAELAAVRAVAPELPILVPGIGAQGGDLEGVMRHGVDRQGAGLLISTSRGVLYASSGSDFASAARAEAQRLRDAIASLRV